MNKNDKLRIEKRKEMLEARLCNNYKTKFMINLISIITMTLMLSGMIYCFARAKVLAGIVYFIAFGIETITIYKNYKTGLKVISNEITRFWNYFDVITEIKEFDLVDEEKKSTHIPRV